MNGIIDIIDLQKSFGSAHILKGITLTIQEGERVVIVGPSGSGKSTFLRCLNCLEDPTGGHIYFEGEDLVNMDVDINIHRRHMGMVFQSFNLFNNKTVLQNITLAPWLTRKGSAKTRAERKKLKAEIDAQAHALLKRIGLDEWAGMYPATLSGGQKQRVAIVRTLAMNPKVILFDEPTSALDPEMVGEVLDLIRQVADEGITMLIVTHEMAFAREVATRVLFIDDGRVLEEAPPAEFFDHPKNPRLQEFLSKVLWR